MLPCRSTNTNSLLTREALDMTVRQYAARLGTAPSNVVAQSQSQRVAHTMTLEAQTVHLRETEAQVAERIVELVRTPRRLWDPDATSTARTRTNAAQQK